MAERMILYWRDIPAQVVVRAGRRSAKRVLSDRFGTAIDACAMRMGARDSDAYLAEWRRSAPEPCGDDIEAEADATAQFLEQAYSGERLSLLIERNGSEQTAHPDRDTGPERPNRQGP